MLILQSYVSNVIDVFFNLKKESLYIKLPHKNQIHYVKIFKTLFFLFKTKNNLSLKTNNNQNVKYYIELN